MGRERATRRPPRLQPQGSVADTTAAVAGSAGASTSAVAIPPAAANDQEPVELRPSGVPAPIRDDAVVWVSWPKKSSKVPTDITEDTIREIALPLGFVDIKV